MTAPAPARDSDRIRIRFLVSPFAELLHTVGLCRRHLAAAARPHAVGPAVVHTCAAPRATPVPAATQGRRCHPGRLTRRAPVRPGPGGEDTWTVTRRLLDNDVRHRLALLARGGVGDLLASVSPALGAPGPGRDVVSADLRCRRPFTAPADTVVLAPSATDRGVLVIEQTAAAVFVVYPARDARALGPVGPDPWECLRVVAALTAGPADACTVAGRTGAPARQTTALLRWLLPAGVVSRLGTDEPSGPLYAATELADLLVGSWCDECD